MTDQTRPALDADGTRLARIASLAVAPVPPVMAFLTGVPVLPILMPSLVFGGLALASLQLDAKVRPLALTVALVGICMMFTAAFAGHAWQIDAHMAFFAALAVVATMDSIPAMVLAVALTAAHHLALGFLLPALVYPSSSAGENLMRTVLHAVIVLAEAGVLSLAILSRSRAKSVIQTARDELAETVAEAQEARQVAEQARERAVEAADRIRQEGRHVLTEVEVVAQAARAAATHAQNSGKLVTRARSDADAARDTVTESIKAMGSMREASDSIGRIVELIDEIARRTDLLALNAAVESARAGDAGRGFAVVANEVRKLAQQSADATLQIRNLVTVSASRVRDGATMVEKAGASLNRITDGITDLEQRMQEIFDGAEAQSRGLSAVTVAIARLDGLTETGPVHKVRPVPQPVEFREAV
jgi:methyl-accepting chemotaxis protein